MPTRGDAPGPTVPPEDPRIEAVSRELAAGRTRSRLLWLARWVAAVLLVLIGMSMVVVPGIPGPPFFLAALLLLAADFAPARRLAVRMQRRIPQFRRLIPQWLRRVSRRDRR